MTISIKKHNTGSRHIRVFISSTIQDMIGERVHLMKKTFPKLRELAAKRDVTLTEVDLRWGITEDETKSGKVVDICFREIENSIPFFIGIIGNRYGWVPTAEELGTEVVEKFPAVGSYLDRRLSVTEMEMQYGVLERQEDMHAYFFMKDGEGEADNLIMIRNLKEAVKASRYPSMEYSSLEDLSAKVEKAFTSLIDELFPEENLSEHQKDRLIQQSFISRLSATYIKNEENFRMLTDFARDPSARYLVITGESGLGKSALVANWSKEHMEGEDFQVIPYFSSNGGNQSHTSILKYLITEICERFGFKEPSGNETEKILDNLFNQIAIRKERIVFVFDAINQIADIGTAKMLGWLPAPPDNVKYIFTTLEDDRTMRVFRDRKYPVFRLEHLTAEQKNSLVNSYLKDNFGKKLKPSQVTNIISDPQCQNTLVLKSLLDELVSNGVYETLGAQIESFLHCTSVTEFYERVIARFENDFGKEFVRKVLCLIAVSRNGVSEDGIMHITGVKPLDWSEFFCGFSTHLSNQSGRLVFTHNYITTTVWKRYLDGDAQMERECRQALVDELRTLKSDSAMQEVPYQMDRLQAWDDLHDYIATYDYLVYGMEHDEVEISTYWRNINNALPGKYSELDYLDNLDGTEDRVLLYTDILSLCGALYHMSDKKNVRKVLSLLIKLIEDEPDKATPEVYLTISGNIGRPENLTYTNKSLEIYRQRGDVLGQINALNSLGGVYYDLSVKEHSDDYGKKAFDAWDKAMELSISLYGENHPLVMDAYRNMGIMCDSDMNKGLSMEMKALEMSLALYGPDHPRTGWVYHFIGVIYRELKMWPEALHYFQEGCRVWTIAYGRDQEIQNSSYGNQGMCHWKMGRLEEALSCYDTCLMIQEAIFEDKGYDYALLQFNRGRILNELGRKEEALSIFGEVEEIFSTDKVKTEARYEPLIEKYRAFRKENPDL